LLEEEVLPQLLLGIRDSNDTLVADSLRALADVVPLLGASKVIGKNRRKLFANGYPGKVCYRVHTVNDQIPDRLVLEWSFSRQFLGLVFERPKKPDRFLNFPLV
jgi:hypothetical protein